MSQNLFLEVKKPEIKETKGTIIIQKLKSSYWGPFSGLKTQDLVKTSRIFSGVIFCRRSFEKKCFFLLLMPTPSACSKLFWQCSHFSDCVQYFLYYFKFFLPLSKVIFYLTNLHIWAWSKIFDHIQKVLNQATEIVFWKWVIVSNFCVLLIISELYHKGSAYIHRYTWK